MEQENTKQKKNNTVLIVILTLIIGLGLGIGGSYYYFNVINEPSSKKDTSSKENVESKWTDISLDDSRFINIYNKLDNYTYKNNYENGVNSFTSNNLAIIALSDLKESDFTKTSEISDFGDNYYTFSGTIMSNDLKNIFDKDIKIDGTTLLNQSYSLKNVDFNGSGMSIKEYDSSTDTYKVRFSGIGGTTGPMPKITKRKIISAQENKDEIKVISKSIYYTNEYSNGNENYKIYSDPQETNLIDNKVYSDDTITNEVLTVDDYLDKAATITEIYKKSSNTNNYYFASSKIK